MIKHSQDSFIIISTRRGKEAIAVRNSSTLVFNLGSQNQQSTAWREIRPPNAQFGEKRFDDALNPINKHVFQEEGAWLQIHRVNFSSCQIWQRYQQIVPSRWKLVSSLQAEVVWLEILVSQKPHSLSKFDTLIIISWL